MVPPAVVFLSSRLDLPGGTERAIANTANLLHDQGHEIFVVILDETADSFYPLHTGIKVIQSNLHFGLTKKGNVITRKLALRSHTKKLKQLFDAIPARIIISTDYVFTIAAWMASVKMDREIFAWEHHHFHWLKKSRFWNYLYYKIYPLIKGVVCLNEAESALFQKIGCRTFVIPNFISKRERSTLDNKNILTVGWLIKRKGTDLVPSIAEKIFRDHKDWQWTLIGEGEEKDELVWGIRSIGLEKNVRIVEPRTPDIDQAYTNASIFIMPSRFECFPMVLLEAMAHGLPCVSFDCPTGPAFIIGHNEDGILVEEADTEALANAITILMDSDEKRKQMGSKAYENIKRFSPENIYPLWESLVRG